MSCHLIHILNSKFESLKNYFIDTGIIKVQLTQLPLIFMFKTII